MFTKIDSVENLRLDLGSYYSHFSSRAALEKPVVSVPYIGFSGLGKTILKYEIVLKIRVSDV